MNYDKELIEKFLGMIDKETSLSSICIDLEMNPYEVLGMVSYIKEKGINIALRKAYDDIYMINLGDRKYHDKNTYSFETDDDNTFKFIAIADTRLGSKSQQLSILNDIYLKGHEMGYDNVFLCGNVSAGLYPITDTYAETNFVNDTQEQIDYIVDYFPYIEGMKTYLITGKIDNKHLKTNKINIGKRIAKERDDMIYLGENSCDVIIDNAVMQILSCKLSKTYTVSYRTQQQIDSFRSEDKPDILLYGGLLQMENYTFRGVRCISVPSVCATTKEMNEKRYSNTIGAWYVTVKTDDKGLLKSVTAISSPYYITAKEDYLKAKALKTTTKRKVRRKKKGDK